MIIIRKEMRQWEWKRWFAWHPVELENGNIAWLTTVERMIGNIDQYGDIIEMHYREVKNETHKI